MHLFVTRGRRRPGFPHPDRAANARVLGAVLLSSLTVPLTITGAAVALPGVQHDLAADLAAAQWVINGYNVCFAAFLTFAGSLADRLGRRRMFAAGVMLFFAGSVMCALAGDIVLLNVARAVAGVGAAGATAAGTSILAATFHGAARTRAFGLLGTVLGAGLAFGPTVSGLLVSASSWRAVFAVPAVLAGVVLPLCALLPRLRGDAGRRVDRAGGALFTAALVLLIFVLVEAPVLGLTAPAVLGALLAALACGAGFVVVERRAADPMFDLGLLANRPFLAFALAAGTMMVLIVPLLVYLPSYLITVIGLDAGQAGAWLLMLTVPSVVLPALGTMIARRSQLLLVAGSVALSGTGVTLLVTVGAGSTAWQLGLPLLLVGTGVGLTTGVIDGLAVSTVRPEQAGATAGLFNTVRLTTETVALAVVGTMLAVISGGHLDGAGFTRALHAVCLALGATAALVTGGVVLLLRGQRRTR
ncbi:MFS transporter [Microtetraspora sp. NBRC 13810]|uniref:MFS transporter n=1 Tax=Microtetraspora sp. NBRC 13810 TaxID=3030990 RepID=UPI0025571197|nr:MFS transporter [Microtetraspora sp. NBRC 13810]GLW10284.1 MFS transporter [Microtetraspora sp. NBRC 13810]